MPKSGKKDGVKVVPLRTEETRVSALAIARQTAAAIERGVFPPSSRLREQELADLFGCSRAPVREALRILESHGLAIIEPMKGARVAAIDDANFYEVFLIRRTLSGLMAEQLASAANSPERDRFIDLARSLVAEAEHVDSERDFAARVTATITAFGKASTLTRTKAFLQSLTFGRQAFQAEFLATDRGRRTIAGTWAKLADAVERRDPKRARAAIERLFDLAYRFVSVWTKSGASEV